MSLLCIHLWIFVIQYEKKHDTCWQLRFLLFVMCVYSLADTSLETEEEQLLSLIHPSHVYINKYTRELID